MGAGSPGCKVGLISDCATSNVRALFCARINPYLSLQSTNKEPVEGLTGLVAVTDILESLGGILAADVEKNFLATAGQKAVGLARVAVSWIGQ